MKPNESKFQKYHAALLRHRQTAVMLLRECIHGHPIGDDVPSDAVPEELSELSLSPLERITEHLHDLGLGQQVHVRFDEAGRDFVLEDADGSVHAKDYDKAVVIIERIWLYQP
jgi:hypothetical protein